MSKFLRLSALFSLFAVTAIFTFVTTLDRKDHLPPGTYVGSFSVGGLEVKKARAYLHQQVNRMIPDYGLMLKVGRKRALALPPEEFDLEFQSGETIDQILEDHRQKPRIARWLAYFRQNSKKKQYPALFSFDEQKLERMLKEWAEALASSAQDAYIDFQKKKIMPEKKGKTINIAAWKKAIQEHLEKLDFSPIPTIYREIQPKVTARMLAGIDLKTPLSFFSTRFNPAKRNRAHNIRLAAKALDGYVLLPGEVFSYNRVVGPRAKSQGYMEAPVIVEGKLVPDYGGGACQVSTTLFNVALRAGLEILQRTPHSRPASYVPVGLDATVAYDYIDFTFRNDLSFPVVLHSEVRGSTLTIALYGKRKEGREVKIKRKIIKTIPNKKKEKAVPYLAVGQRRVEENGNFGYVVVLEQMIRKNKKTKVHRFTSRYAPVDRVVLVGKAPEQETKSPELKRKKREQEEASWQP